MRLGTRGKEMAEDRRYVPLKSRHLEPFYRLRMPLIDAFNNNSDLSALTVEPGSQLRLACRV